nr:helix-turn-helix domain-containing protein [uncultured Roseateles sp.]
MNTWKARIDRASEMCGGQNALARRLGIAGGNLSAARAGTKPLAKDHIAVIAEILGEDPAELWLVAQDARNPFRHAIAASIALAFTVIVTALFPADSYAQSKAYKAADTGTDDTLSTFQ